jgi:hypothetical protein
MPFPIDKIDRLGNYDGTWSLGVRCLCCGHARLIPAIFLIRLFGRETRLATVAPRLYCSRCRGRGCACAGKDLEAQVWIPR